MSQYQPRGLYFEEFEVGQVFYSTGRTITEGDIVTFAGLSGDYNQMQSGLIEGTTLAFREINNWKFAKPTYIGDTVHVEVKIKGTKALPRLGGGAVEIALAVKNQENEVVMKGLWTVLIVSRPETED
jgi:3-hydroxybutyryl-CoA dehydratase